MNTKECVRLDKAYRACRKNLTKETYIQLLEALEAELEEDASCVIPAEEQAVADAKDGKPFPWPIAENEKGKALLVFTSREQAEKHAAKGTVPVKLRACLGVLLQNKELMGIALNILDGANGIFLDRQNLTVAVKRAQAALIPVLPGEMMTESIMRLFEIAVGVPTSVCDINRDLETLGGADAQIKKAHARWEATAKAQSFPSAEEGLKSVARAAMEQGFVAGVFVRKDAKMAREADPKECLSRVPMLSDDINQNADEYLLILGEKIRAAFPTMTPEQMAECWRKNVTNIALGAFYFAFGWGIAKFCEQEGADALEALKAHEKAVRRKLEEAHEKAST